jgi:hypothetical protein
MVRAHRPILVALAFLIAPVLACDPAAAGAADRPGLAPVAEGERDDGAAPETGASQAGEMLGPPAPPAAGSSDMAPAEPPRAGASAAIVPPIKRVMPKPPPKPSASKTGETAKAAAKSKVKKVPAGQASISKAQKKSP